MDIFFFNVLYRLVFVDAVQGELHEMVDLFEDFPLLIQQPTG
jgi:hypothetical protein